MGKAVEMMKKKKKKKGRPSLLDLQKRSLKEEQSQSQRIDNSAIKPSQNYRTSTPAHLRRSTRRNPAQDDSDSYDGEDSSLGRRSLREKKLKVVLKLPNSSSGGPGGSDSGAEEDGDGLQNQKKRKIAAIGDGSGGGGSSEKGEKPTTSASTHQGARLDSEVSTPLPDKKLLLFILDRLQKKDTYGVFSEPVDPEELPDYHDIIEHPMDFGTVRKKLNGGAYANLEQFENDVFLICSNAKKYNAPDTVYFRQARSVQELAKKNFSDLRKDSDDNEPQMKIVRRGRPPTKHLKRPPGRPPLDRAAHSDTMLASGGENATSASFDLRKGPFSADKTGLMNSSGRLRSHDVHYDEFLGSSMKSSQMKLGKKENVPEETRRNTYRQCHPSTSGREPSVLTMFDQGRKQLMPVGLQPDHGYARSLARFAANLGPVAWKVASRMIERSLPADVKFGPGWVGENDVITPKPSQPTSPAPSSLWPFAMPKSSCSKDTNHCAPEPKDSSSEKREEEHSNPPENHPEHIIEKPKAEGSNSLKPPSHSYRNGFTGRFMCNNNLEEAHIGKTVKAKPPSAPPDLNVRFHSPGSPKSTRTDLAQPDLALQL